MSIHAETSASVILSIDTALPFWWLKQTQRLSVMGPKLELLCIGILLVKEIFT